MATVSSFPVDPTKFAEYPILLGDKLAGKDSAKGSELINVNYNYKRKGFSPQQKAVITQGSSDDLYDLTIEDKAGNTEQTPLTYKYRGSVDPSSSMSEPEYGKLFLVFDSKRKAFILEPVSASLNFNLRAAPGKTDQQVSEQYPQLGALLDESRPSNNSRPNENEDAEETGPADESNPFDFRHFLPKEKVSETDKAAPKFPSTKALHLDNSTTKHTPTHLTPVGSDRKQKTKSAPKAKTQTDPLRQQKRTTKTTQAPAPAPKPDPHPVDFSPSEEESKGKAEQPAASPSSNIIVDGDLIIDMGSPPPQRPAFKINPGHFSNNTSANEAGYGSDEDEGELEDRRLPSPAMRDSFSHQQDKPEVKPEDEDEDEEEEVGQHEPQPQADADAMDDDDLAAEMEAAFEQEEKQDRNQELQRMQQQQQSQRIVSDDDESEVSEEE